MRAALAVAWPPSVALAAALLAPPAAAAALETAAQIEQCVRDNLPRKSSVQTVVFRTTSRVDVTSESRATLHWKVFEAGLSKVLMRFTRPLDLRGAGVLLIEKQGRRPDTFLYLPELGTVRRVSSRSASSSLFGTDFSYEDFERLVGMSADAERERGEDGEIAGRPVYVVTAKPDPESRSAYERVVTFVDQETCVPLRTESYEPGGALRKQLSADPEKITREGALFVPRQQTMQDLRDETRTDLLIETIDVDADIHQKMFSARELEAGGD